MQLLEIQISIVVAADRCFSQWARDGRRHVLDIWFARHFVSLSSEISAPDSLEQRATSKNNCGIVAVVGASFGSMAGAFSTLFAGNALAAQQYVQKIDAVKSFCKVRLRSSLSCAFHD